MDYTSADFKIQYISSYSLYVSSDLIRDQLVIADDNNRILLIKTYDALQPSQDVAKLLSLPFPRVYISLPHQQLIWVPNEVYRDSDLGAFTSFFDSDATVYSKTIESLGVTALYQYDLLLYNRWKKIFATAKFVPVFEVALQQSQPQIPIRGSVLGVHVYDRQVDLFLFMDGAFRFYNSFEVATVDDMSYFVLQLLKNTSITSKVGKVLLGGAELNSPWAKRLALYTDDLELVKAKNRWHVEDISKEINLSGFNVLADSVLCV
jgi:hypothetical protein